TGFLFRILGVIEGYDNMMAITIANTSGRTKTVREEGGEIAKLAKEIDETIVLIPETANFAKYILGSMDEGLGYPAEKFGEEIDKLEGLLRKNTKAAHEIGKPNPA